MAALTYLELQSLRNIQQAKLDFSPQFNIIFGDNGSGKTSLLEAIYLLAQGRSFRSHLNGRLIQHQHEKLTVFAKLSDGHRMGLEKQRQAGTKLRFDGETAKSIATLAQCLPLQLVHPDRFRLVADSAQYRRQFMDWGLFHVEQQFFEAWRGYRAVLAQRNAALKQQRSTSQIIIWDQQMAVLAQQLHDFRQTFVTEFLKCFQKVLPTLLNEPIEIQYKAGWDTEKGLQSVLEGNLGHDRQLGFTSKGPHRADLKFIAQGLPASAVLSRGQQKLLICALALSQIYLVKAVSNKQCVFLFDDLPSELDEHSRGAVLKALAGLGGQVFITGIQQQPLEVIRDIGDASMFHVEHGCFKLF